MPAKSINIGDRFGKLKVVGDAPSYVAPNGNISKRKTCICDCGKITTVTEGALRHLNTRSCGCLIKERTRHGHAKTNQVTRTYRIWKGIIQRCTNPKNAEWHNYGGRGITLCNEWTVFENFLHDMGECPNGLTVDRIDNNGPYCPANVRWASHKEQTRNQRRNKIFTVNGKTECLAALCEHFDKPYGLVIDRLRHDWPIYEALTRPKGLRYKHHNKSTSNVQTRPSLT